MGKGKDPNADNQRDHVSRPLASLKDPSSFGPPPKRNGASSISSPRTTSSRSLGAASSEGSHQVEEGDDSKPAPPPLPYRANRTGLETNHLPPPPGRNNNNNTSNSFAQPASSPSTRPNLPPRLPARAPAPPSDNEPAPPPYSETDNVAQMNPGAVSRLGQAGVSVPGLGIGGSDGGPSPTAQTNLNKQVNELQSRFGNMTTSSSQAPGNLQDHVVGSKNGSTYGQSRERLHVDANSPSSTSALDTRNTGSGTSNFSDHFEAGKKKLNAFNQKHKITDRVQSYFERPPVPVQEQSAPPPPPPHPNLSRQSSTIDVEALNNRKPPPPPPPAKKPELQSKSVGSSSTAASTGSPSPPPLPLGTKPR